MTDSPTYPPRPWRPLVALLVSLVALGYFTHLWQQRAPLLPREYLVDYVRLSLPAIPGWNRYEVVWYGNRLALPTDEGEFTRSRELVDRPQFGSWLKANIYEGKTLPWVLFWPLVGSGLVLIPSLWIAMKLGNEATRQARDGRLLRGPHLVSHWRFNLPTLFRRKGAFYIETR